MKKCTAIVMFLLLTHLVYGREGQHGVGTISALLAAASTSTNTSDMEGNEADDQEMGSDTEGDGADANGTDSDSEMKTGTHTNGDNETDDMNGETSSIKNAIRASLKATAMKQSQSSVGQMALTLDPGSSPLQTIKELLEPAASRSIAVSTMGSQTGLFDSSSTVTGGSAMPASGTLLVANCARASGQLTSSAAPEPSAWILAATGMLAPIGRRRRWG